MAKMAEAGMIEVANTDELKDVGMKSVKVEGREILLARVGDKFYAANNRCPHRTEAMPDGLSDLKDSLGGIPRAHR